MIRSQSRVSSGRKQKDFLSGVVEVTPLPPEVVAGSYHLQIDLTYQANPVRTVTETYDTPNFTIVPKRDGNGAQLP